VTTQLDSKLDSDNLQVTCTSTKRSIKQVA